MFYLKSAVLLVFLMIVQESTAIFGNTLRDLNFFRCMLKRGNSCPHDDILFFMYTPLVPKGRLVDVTRPKSFKYAGFQKHQQTAFIIHGFNGTQESTHTLYLKDAYLSRNFNVITVDWSRLTYFPCYVSAISNTKQVAQCTAQMYAFLTYKGAHRKHITCVGHSLGAHICGMMRNHLTSKPYKIIGLDPARPLIERSASAAFRLTRDDADVVQVLHTNAGTLGQTAMSGSVDFCINGGREQPFCKGHYIRRARCSHFLSVCYLANSIFQHKKAIAVPCPRGCIHLKRNKLPIYDSRFAVSHLKLGPDTEDDLTGTYCIQLDFAKNCPFNDE